MQGWTHNNKFDYSLVPDEKAPPAEGYYKAEVFAVELHETKSGLPSLKLTVRLGEGEDGTESRKLTTSYIVLTQNALWKVTEVAEAFGVKGPEGDNSEESMAFANRIKEANDVVVKIKHRTYKNKEGQDATSADVAKFLSPKKASKYFGKGGGAKSPF